MYKEKIIVTGANGFLGKAVCKAIENENRIIIKIPGHDKYDLRDSKNADALYGINKPDTIIHLAAKVGGIGANKNNPGLFIYDNLIMGINLIEGARRYGNLKKFIMVGTVCSYPKYAKIPFQEEDIWDGYPEETNAPYGIAKKTLIEMLIAYNKQYGLNSTNLIPVNMYGPNDNFNPEYSHVIPALILKIDRAIDRNENEVKLWGTGRASREFLYVDDCANAISSSIDIETTPYPINIGTGSEITIKDLAHKLKDLMGYNGNLKFQENGMDGQPRRSLSTHRASRVLGFTAKTQLDDGLQKTIEWYYKNKDTMIDYFDNIQ